MAGTVIDRVALGGTTTNRKWYVDVLDPIGGNYVGVFGIQEFKDNISQTLQDASDFDGGGWKSQENTSMAQSLEFKVRRGTPRLNRNIYDPGQEIIRRAARKAGLDNTIKVRWYEMEPNGPRIEAYECFVSAGWTPDGGNMEALSTAAVVLTGQGQPTELPHPEGITTAAIGSVSPTGLGAGGVVAIRGNGFTGATAAQVKFNNINATKVDVLDDGLLLATLPTGAAGLIPVTVKSGPAFNYARIA